MPRLRFCLALLAVFTVVAPFGLAGAVAAEPEQTVPQGEDPPGADNGAGAVPPPTAQDGVIPPPDIGDEGIHTEVPNPGAGHEEEVIPPPAAPSDPSAPQR